MALDPASSWGGESKTQGGSPITARVGAALPALLWCSDTPLTTWVPPAPCQAPAEQVGLCLFAELPSTQQGCARYLPGKQTPRQNAKAAATTQPPRFSAGREPLLQQDPQSRRACSGFGYLPALQMCPPQGRAQGSTSVQRTPGNQRPSRPQGALLAHGQSMPTQPPASRTRRSFQQLSPVPTPMHSVIPPRPQDSAPVLAQPHRAPPCPAPSPISLAAL